VSHQRDRLPQGIELLIQDIGTERLHVHLSIQSLDSVERMSA